MIYRDASNLPSAVLCTYMTLDSYTKAVGGRTLIVLDSPCSETLNSSSRVASIIGGQAQPAARARLPTKPWVSTRD